MGTSALRRSFRANLAIGLKVIWPVVSGLIGLMVSLGIVVGLLEGWSIENSIYFSFVTGLTIGYGDFAPTMLLTRMLSILIGATGTIVTALVAAVTVRAFPMPHDIVAKTSGGDAHT